LKSRMDMNYKRSELLDLGIGPMRMLDNWCR